MPNVIRIIVFIVLLVTLSTTSAQEGTTRISGDRLSPFVLPIEPLADAVSISALRADCW